jgi:hypothetical protein
MWSLGLDGDGAMSCSGPGQSGGVRHRQHTNDRTGLLSCLRPERRISGWPASGQSNRLRGAAADHIVAMAGPGPMDQAQKCRVRAPPHPLYGSRDGTPDTCRAQPDQIYRDHNSFPMKPTGYFPPRKPPLPSQPTGTRQKICDRSRQLRVPESPALANSNVAIHAFGITQWPGGGSGPRDHIAV